MGEFCEVNTIKMSTQAQAPTLFREESSNSQHDDPLRLKMQKLQSLRDEMRDIGRDVTNLSNQQREVSPHGSLNATTLRSNGPFNCHRTTEFHQPPHFDEELHPPPSGGRRGHYASSCPTKRALIFREDLNGWIEMEEDESGECVEENGDGDSRTNPFQEGEDDVNWLDMQEHQGVMTRAKVKQLKIHKDQIEQEKFQGLNFEVQDFMGQHAKVLNKLEIGNLP
ncbi:hypothetical protein M9H77_07925 [Catharanthus roseus]|uniref:Uncharacterized protein n=1 Tax=Catharanthus roseus TaxID=4058 RepID=A0ACC0BWC5_CATRO|nr:hypothetical protein M9H77_07925 [Catharanthus roseus]